MALNKYLAQVSNAASAEDGEKLARLLRYSDVHAQSLANELGNVGFDERKWAGSPEVAALPTLTRLRRPTVRFRGTTMSK